MTLFIKENGLKVSGELKKFERISNAGNRVTHISALIVVFLFKGLLDILKVYMV